MATQSSVSPAGPAHHDRPGGHELRSHTALRSVHALANRDSDVTIRLGNVRSQSFAQRISAR